MSDLRLVQSLDIDVYGKSFKFWCIDDLLKKVAVFKYCNALELSRSLNKITPYKEPHTVREVILKNVHCKGAINSAKGMYLMYDGSVLIFIESLGEWGFSYGKNVAEPHFIPDVYGTGGNWE